MAAAFYLHSSPPPCIHAPPLPPLPSPAAVPLLLLMSKKRMSYGEKPPGGDQKSQGQNKATGGALVPCTPTPSGKRKGDVAFEACHSFCASSSARAHCNYCRCRGCSFCTHSIRNITGHRAVWRAGPKWCSAMLRNPSHLMRNMWAVKSWGIMHKGAAACWDRQRDQPEKALKSRDEYFDNVEHCRFCDNNWYEGHGGTLGKVGLPPSYERPAPALMGFDGGIHSFCLSRIPESERSKYAMPQDGILRGGIVAKACVAASMNILNMVGKRVPYNLCRNLEWQVCAIKGRLPNQDTAAGIIFANPPGQLQVKPWMDGPAGLAGNCSTPVDLPSVRRSNGSGYTVSDVFYLEVCIFQKICRNGDDIFRLARGEPFHCKFSHRGFLQLRDLLVSGPAAGAPVDLRCSFP